MGRRPPKRQKQSRSGSEAFQHAELLAALPHLTAQQLREVKQRVDYLLRNDAEEATMTDDQLILYEAFATLLRERHVPGVRQREGIEMRRGRLQGFNLEAFRNGWESVEAYRLEYFPDNSRPAKRAFYSMVASVLRARSLKSGVLSIQRLVAAMPDIAEAVEECFPGYLESGILGAMLQRFVDG